MDHSHAASKITRPRRLCRLDGWRRTAFAAAICLLLAACGDDTDAPGGTPATSKVGHLLEQLRTRYYWNTQVPATVTEADFADEHAALEQLRAPEDRYSTIVDAVEYQRFFSAGQALAFGIIYRTETNRLLLLAVQPNSPAFAAGLRRGQYILAINQESIALLQSQQRVDAAFGESTRGLTREFRLDDAGIERVVSVSKDVFDIAYVPAEALFERGGRRIGYVHFYSFATPGIAPWQAALDRLIAAGADDLIVDLRSNGGGLLSSTARVGSALGELDGKIMSRLRFNAQNSASNRAYTFDEDPRGAHIDRLVWLTSAQTCSASEALIAGIAPWRQAVHIGETTCGKPVGFTPTTFDGSVFNVVTFALENSQGDAAYFNGLEPECPVTDDGRGQFGQADETLTAAALSWLETQSCPPLSSAGEARIKHSGAPTPGGNHWPDPISALK